MEFLLTVQNKMQVIAVNNNKIHNTYSSPKLDWIFILWRNRPMRELIKFRNLKKCDCAAIVCC
jgi:hypothetical protein